MNMGLPQVIECDKVVDIMGEVGVGGQSALCPLRGRTPMNILDVIEHSVERHPALIGREL